MKTITNNSKNVAIIDKMDFESVDDVFSSLFGAFHPNGIQGEEDHADPKFIALWTLFLASVGWTEEEYWAEEENHVHTCEKCKAEMGEPDEEELPSLKKLEGNSSKSN